MKRTELLTERILTQDYTLIQKAAENEKKRVIINEWITDKIGNDLHSHQRPIFELRVRTNGWIKE